MKGKWQQISLRVEAFLCCLVGREGRKWVELLLLNCLRKREKHLYGNSNILLLPSSITTSKITFLLNFPAISDLCFPLFASAFLYYKHCNQTLNNFLWMQVQKQLKLKWLLLRFNSSGMKNGRFILISILLRRQTGKCLHESNFLKSFKRLLKKL